MCIVKSQRHYRLQYPRKTLIKTFSIHGEKKRKTYKTEQKMTIVVTKTLSVNLYRKATSFHREYKHASLN